MFAMGKDSMTEQAEILIDDLRAEKVINEKLQNLLTFIIHARDNQGVITPQNVLNLAEAAEEATNALLEECRQSTDGNDIKEHSLLTH
jgi:hypothetical protein